MINYRILEMGAQKAIGPVGNIVLSQEVMEIGTLDSFAIDEEVKERIIHIIEDMRGDECLGIFFIAKYENEDYVECVGVLYGEIHGLDQDFYSPTLEAPDEKYCSACDVAHHKLAPMQKWDLIVKYAEEHNLMDYICDLVNERSITWKCDFLEHLFDRVTEAEENKHGKYN